MSARLDFKAIAQHVDVEQVAAHFSIPLKRSGAKLRGKCPACQTDDERSLALYPETASYRCYAAGQSGDSISLYAHLCGTGMYAAAASLSELFPIGNGSTNSLTGTAPRTQPQKPEGGANRPNNRLNVGTSQKPVPKPESNFDPDAYAAKLAYTDEVAVLGITEADATRLGIGWSSHGFHRGRVVFPVRNPDGSISGFVGVVGSDIKLPQRWLTTNVVSLKRA